MSKHNINDGGVDMRTTAELSLAPAEPEERSLPPVGKLKFGGLLGAVSKAKSLASSTFSSMKSALDAKKKLTALSTSLADTVKGFDAAGTALLIGKTFLKGAKTAWGSVKSALENVKTLSVQGAKTALGFPPASDLVQISDMSAGTPIAGTAAAATVTKQLEQRKEQVTGIATNFAKRANLFSIDGPGLTENIENRTTYPLLSQIGLPSASPLALGGKAATSSSIMQDKLKFTRTGIGGATIPTTWARLVTSRTDLLKGFTAQPGFLRSPLNMVFMGTKTQPTFSEPASPAAPQAPYNKARQTESGHAVEFDDTPGAERIHVFHRSGSCVEMHPDGKVVCKLLGGGYIVAEADLHVSVRGVCHISVDGDANIYTKGKLDLQADEGINIHTKKDFNVFAKNINLRAKAKSTLDGTIIDLRYVTLPGIPVVTTSGIAPTLNMAAMKKDFPEIHGQVCKAVFEHKLEMGKLKAEVIQETATAVTESALKSPAIVGATTPYTLAALAETAAMVLGTKAALNMVLKLQSGIFPTGTAPKFEFPALTAEQEPVENPLGNPLAYTATTPAAANYRTLFFDTPQEMGDVELYQAHQQTQLLLGDIESIEPKIGGAKTTPATGIVAPATLPIVNYLDRDTYRGNFNSDPGQTLGGTSFTYGELVDSLSRADVANPHITEPVTI